MAVKKKTYAAPTTIRIGTAVYHGSAGTFSVSQGGTTTTKSVSGGTTTTTVKSSSSTPQPAAAPSVSAAAPLVPTKTPINSSGSTTTAAPPAQVPMPAATAAAAATPAAQAELPQAKVKAPSGWGNVADTFELIGRKVGNALMPGQPFGDLSAKGSAPLTFKDKFTDIVTNPLVVFGLPAIPAAYVAAPLVFGGSAATATAAGATAAAIAAPIAAPTALSFIKKALSNPIIAGVTGFAAGSLTGGIFKGDAPTTQQAAPQVLQPTITTITDSGHNVQDTRTDNRQWNTQQTYNNIVDSPGASIGGSPIQTPSIDNQIDPGQAVPTYNYPSQDTQAGQTLAASSGIGFGTIALIGLALYAFKD